MSMYDELRVNYRQLIDKPNTESKDKNAAAIAWVEQWYATPDTQPPHYWDEFEELLKTHLTRTAWHARHREAWEARKA
jgi:hypothetical protein